MDTLPFTENTAVVAFMLSVYASIFCGGVAVNIRLWKRLQRAPPDWRACAERLIARASPPRDALPILGTWILVTLAGTMAAQHWWGSARPLPAAATRWMLLYNVLTQSLVVLLALRMALRRGSPEAAFGYRPGSLRLQVSQGALAYLAAMPFFFAASLVWMTGLRQLGVPLEPQTSVEMFVMLDSGWSRAGFLLLAVAGAPLCEELVFRGLAFPFAVKHFGLWPAAIAVSAVFALIHTHVPTLVPLFCLGMAFAVSYTVTGSLAVPVIVHAIFNAVNLLCLLVGDWLA